MLNACLFTGVVHDVRVTGLPYFLAVKMRGADSELNNGVFFGCHFYGYGHLLQTIIAIQLMKFLFNR